MSNNVNYDLFGNPIQQDELLRDKYIEPPFSALDSRGDNWQKRLFMWHRKGVRDNIIDPVLCEIIFTWFGVDEYEMLGLVPGDVASQVAKQLGHTFHNACMEDISEWEKLNGVASMLFCYLSNANTSYDEYLVGLQEIMLYPKYNIMKNGYVVAYIDEKANNGVYLGMVVDIVKMFKGMGFDYYNDIVVIKEFDDTNPVDGVLFTKVHSNLLVFKKNHYSGGDYSGTTI